MKCMIPGQNVKILARALHSLARVGDDLFVDPLSDGVVLCTVNSSQSAFAEFIFHQTFFSSYNAEADSPESLPKCKISMKSCLSVFKSSHSMDKMIDWCQLRLEPSGVQLVFKVKFTGGFTKTYFLPIIESETLQVKYKKSDTVKLVASSKLLSGIVKNFRSNEDEITLSVTRQKATFRNHIDTFSEKNKTVRTELGLLAGEFEMYSVKDPVSLTFCLKQLRAVVAFAEPAGLPVHLNFEVSGRPVIFSACNESVYEANFVVSTLTTVGESQSQESHKSAVYCSNKIQKQQEQGKTKEGKQVNSNCVQLERVPTSLDNVIDSCKSNQNDNEFMGNGASVNISASRKRHRDSSELSNNNGQNHKTFDRYQNNDKSNDDNNNTGNNVNKSVVSITSTQDTVVIANEEMDLDENIPNSPQHSLKNIISNEFNRCFDSAFQRSFLPDAYDYDGLEDSDL